MASLPDFDKLEPTITGKNSNPGNVETNDDKNTGFECEFVEKPPSVLQSECPVCLLLLREPYQVTCCGKSYCHLCIEKIKTENKPCPTCNAEKFADFPNKGLQQPLYQFKVRCTHTKEGCEWTGELGELDNHLNLDPQPDSELTGCDYAEINCRYRYAGCKVRVTRNRIKTHITNESAQHLALLENQYEQQVVEIEKLRTENSKQKELNTTLKEEILKVNETWLTKIQAYFPIPPVTLTMTYFGYYHENKREWLSKPFYTDYRGYKLCLQVEYQVSNTREIQYLSLKLCLMQGEFDDDLPWPFDRKVEVEVISQTIGHANKSVAIYQGKISVYSSSCNMYKELPPMPCTERVHGRGQTSHSPISTTESAQLIPASDIHKYVKNDHMEFRIIYAGPHRE